MFFRMTFVNYTCNEIAPYYYLIIRFNSLINTVDNVNTLEYILEIWLGQINQHQTKALEIFKKIQDFVSFARPY